MRASSWQPPRPRPLSCASAWRRSWRRWPLSGTAWRPRWAGGWVGHTPCERRASSRARQAPRPGLLPRRPAGPAPSPNILTLCSGPRCARCAVLRRRQLAEARGELEALAGGLGGLERENSNLEAQVGAACIPHVGFVCSLVPASRPRGRGRVSQAREKAGAGRPARTGRRRRSRPLRMSGGDSLWPPLWPSSPPAQVDQVTRALVQARPHGQHISSCLSGPPLLQVDQVTQALMQTQAAKADLERRVAELEQVGASACARWSAPPPEAFAASGEGCSEARDASSQQSGGDTRFLAPLPPTRRRTPPRWACWRRSWRATSRCWRGSWRRRARRRWAGRCLMRGGGPACWCCCSPRMAPPGGPSRLCVDLTPPAAICRRPSCAWPAGSTPPAARSFPAT